MAVTPTGRLGRHGVWALLPALAGCLYAAPVTPLAAQVGTLYNLVATITGSILVLVWMALGVALWRYRHRPGRRARIVHGNLLVEVVWTLIPAVLLLVIAIPAYRTILYTEHEPAAALVVEVVGHQWYWEYRYPNQGLVVSNEPLRVPAGENVQLVLSSADVIHNWWVPAFGYKMSAIPGRLNRMWFHVDRPGTYEGQCAELCGTMHAKMGITVDAMAPPAFASWVQATKLAQRPAAQTASGKALFDKNCAVCHQANGQGLADTFPPLAGAEVPNGPADAHIRLVLHGLTGPLAVRGHTYNGVMPSFLSLIDAELAAILTYERTSWGNTGSPVTPEQVHALRGR